jgi:glycosyltransferase involved in cell wall biosynthesis
MIKFAVLMSVYIKDDPKLFDIAIKSIFSQTVKPMNVHLIVDGPVGQNLNRIIDFYKNQPDFHVHYLETNQGLANALNYGLTQIHEEYIARMDSDDFSFPNRFEIQCKFLESNPDVSLLGTNVYEDHNNTIMSKKIPISQTDILKSIHKRNPFNHPSVIFKKKSVISVGGYPNIYFNEDYFLWVKLIVNNYLCLNIPEFLLKMNFNYSTYRRRGGLRYLKAQLNIINYLYEKSYLSISKYFITIIYISLIRLAPVSIRKLFYSLSRRKYEH